MPTDVPPSDRKGKLVHPEVTRYPALLAIVLVCAGVFVASEMTESRVSWEYGAKPAEVIEAWDTLVSGQLNVSVLGELGTLVAALFLHGGIDHILWNMVFFWLFGTLTAQLLGQWPAFVCFFVCGVCGNILQVALNPDSMRPIIGASGSVCGFEGIYLALALRWTLDYADVWPLGRPVAPMQLCIFALVGVGGDVYFQISGDEAIAYGGHIGGFASGFLIATVIAQFFPSEANFRRRVYGR